MSKDVKWRPDYIVVAGDMVDGRKKDYEPAKKYLDSFVSDPYFNIHPFAIVTVPGNHDKDFPKALKGGFFLMKEKRKNELFSEAVNSSVFNFNLKEGYSTSFKSYGDFYRPYVSDKLFKDEKMCYEYDFPAQYLGNELNDIALTSGLKVFHDTKTCFLSINTEWVYLPDGYVGNSAQARICKPVVYASINQYKERYSDYMLITVMHRNPAEFSWNELNLAETHKPDILQYIYHFSDVLLTGHNHIERILPPNMMNNRVQHFQLGSASMPSRKNNELVQFCSALINVDPIEGSVNLLNLHYNYLHQEWQTENGGSYKLADKSVRISNEKRILYQTDFCPDPVLSVSAKGISMDDVRSAVEASLPGLKYSGYSSFYAHVNESKIIEHINAFISRENKAFIVVWSDSIMDHRKCQDLIGKIMDNSENRKRFYQQKLTTIEVQVKVQLDPMF